MEELERWKEDAGASLRPEEAREWRVPAAGATMLASVTERLGGARVQRKLAERLARRAETSGDSQVQRRAAAAEGATGAAGGAPRADVLAAAEQGLAGAAQSLPHLPAIQSAFGGHDVGEVRAHVGGPAREAADRMGALAFATGGSVAFREAPDLHTAAHEAAHVVQQRAGVQLRGGVGQEGDRYERHADAVADAVVAGRSAAPLLDGFAGPASAPGGTVQHKKPDGRARPVGASRRTDHGDYWVVPDGTSIAAAGHRPGGEVIQQSAFDAMEKAWAALASGAGRLAVSDVDAGGATHAGFHGRVMARLGMLMAGPVGRQLVVGLVLGSGGHGSRCTIRPSRRKLPGGAVTAVPEAQAGGAEAWRRGDGAAGGGSDSSIELDPSVGDGDVRVFDGAGNDLADPVYILLGHELIHVRHIAAGMAEMTAPADADYETGEEESTIATGDINENELRAEHGLARRHGHGGRDRRP